MAGFWTQVLNRAVSRLQRCPRRVALPQNPSVIFTEVTPGYAANGGPASESVLAEHMPRVNFSRFDSGFLGLFGRVVQTSIFTCFQYLFVWDWQLVPPHPMDYAPLCVYSFEPNQKRTVLFDTTHYFRGAKNIDDGKRPVFAIDPFWHAFWPQGFQQTSTPVRPLHMNPLCDSHLQRWWGHDGILDGWWNIPNDRTPHLKVENNLKNPVLMMNPAIWKLDMESPTKTPVVEELASHVRYPFIASTLSSDSMVDCLHMFRDVLAPQQSISSVQQRKLHLGQMAMLTLFSLYNLIELESPSGSWEPFAVLLSEAKNKKDFHRMTNIKGLYNDLKETSMRVTEQGGQYFKDLKNALDGDSHRPLLGRLKAWHSKSRKVFRKRYSIEWDELIARVGKPSGEEALGD